ncbi:MAG TPA: hypothetical protein PKY35_09805 [Candidatus Hydrogenedentes bacterium]|nr:hypothetical protein [Candidatus Hydrogenedentota bacterium]HOL77313.1 hypothetical protein [Candidatus Hydrogenedentota bacterium]
MLTKLLEQGKVFEQLLPRAPQLGEAVEDFPSAHMHLGLPAKKRTTQEKKRQVSCKEPSFFSLSTYALVQQARGYWIFSTR